MPEKPTLRKDLERLAGKVDALGKQLNSKIDRVAIETVKLKADVAEIKVAIATKLMTKDEFRHYSGMVQKIVDELSTTRDERITFPHLLDLHGKTLQDHSKRISALEPHEK